MLPLALSQCRALSRFIFSYQKIFLGKPVVLRREVGVSLCSTRAKSFETTRGANQPRFENSPIRELEYGDSGVTRRNLELADEMPHGIDNDGNGEYDTNRNPD